jgi:hypothetical protein
LKADFLAALLNGEKDLSARIPFVSWVTHPFTDLEFFAAPPYLLLLVVPI